MHKFLLVLRDLEQLISNHTYKDKLPSIRVLANQYNVNKSTIIRAMNDLERRHLVYSVPKSGFYVVKSTMVSEYAMQGIIDFATSSPDPSVFPYLD
ncbi:hypothetical protein GCM10010912_70110 [Paenibacillus albidus]|uniref:HTH gntR-type domain-containing protein n=1 Tax=Paenibacillus albidus TaxID=2041023 RepID=A0A917LEG4_9BACL|nr:winged helix-turn-helix domain-containing protein [Paenibacillus albidus]GGG15659.1 hypothetical protein GCM10010912_70110 [Paenibacillus albidus]